MQEKVHEGESLSVAVTSHEHTTELVSLVNLDACCFDCSGKFQTVQRCISH